MFYCFCQINKKTTKFKYIVLEQQTLTSDSGRLCFLYILYDTWQTIAACASELDYLTFMYHGVVEGIVFWYFLPIKDL